MAVQKITPTPFLESHDLGHDRGELFGGFVAPTFEEEHRPGVGSGAVAVVIEGGFGSAGDVTAPHIRTAGAASER